MTEPVIPRRLTSGVPASPDLTATEAATVARFDAAPDAEESLRVRVALAVNDATYPCRCTYCWGTSLTVADAAIAVIRGDDA